MPHVERLLQINLARRITGARNANGVAKFILYGQEVWPRCKSNSAWRPGRTPFHKGTVTNLLPPYALQLDHA
jgi:hypothetical protein